MSRCGWAVFVVDSIVLRNSIKTSMGRNCGILKNMDGSILLYNNDVEMYVQTNTNKSDSLAVFSKEK